MTTRCSSRPVSGPNACTVARATTPGIRRSMRLLVLLIALGVFATACGNESRPTMAEWRQSWIAVQRTLPDRAELGDPPDRARCQEALPQLRESPGELLPAPDDVLDESAREWLQLAEHAMFACGRSDALDETYAQIEEVTIEIDAILDRAEA